MSLSVPSFSLHVWHITLESITSHVRNGTKSVPKCKQKTYPLYGFCNGMKATRCNSTDEPPYRWIPRFTGTSTGRAPQGFTGTRTSEPPSDRWTPLGLYSRRVLNQSYILCHPNTNFYLSIDQIQTTKICIMIDYSYSWRNHMSLFLNMQIAKLTVV